MKTALLNSKEAAEYLGISQPMFRQLVSAGTVPVVMVPGLKKPRFSITDLDAVIQKGKSHETQQNQTADTSGGTAGQGTGAGKQVPEHRKHLKKHTDQV